MTTGEAPLLRFVGYTGACRFLSLYLLLGCIARLHALVTARDNQAPQHSLRVIRATKWGSGTFNKANPRNASRKQSLSSNHHVDNKEFDTTTIAVKDEVLSSSLSAEVRNKQAIVVGGGPVGLAVALTLSQPKHGYNVTVLEQATQSQATYNPSRSFLFNVNPRGLIWFQNSDSGVDDQRASNEASEQEAGNKSNDDNTESYQSPQFVAFRKLQERGYAPPDGTMGSMVYVPANPAIPINPAKVPAFRSTGQKHVNSNNNSRNLNQAMNYWIPRHLMIELLQECCLEQEARRQKQRVARTSKNHSSKNQASTKAPPTKIEPGIPGSITLVNGKQCQSVVPTSNGLIAVTCSDGSVYTSSLVVAADGVHSQVRQCLSDASKRSGWLSQSSPRRFQPRIFISPSTGLKLKALQFPLNFTIPNNNPAAESHGTSSGLKTDSETMYMFSSAGKNAREICSLGLLPVKQGVMNINVTVRPANVNGRPDHEVWSLQTAEQAKQWFQRIFPRLDWENLIPDAEWERFVQANGTTFPPCQYSLGSGIASPDGLSGIVLMGDACHAFPPDIGQGINAGFQDVVAFDRALQSLDIRTGRPRHKDRGTTSRQGNTWTLGDAIHDYDRNRSPEHAALIRLARFGAPYQYRQTWLRDIIGRYLWTANVIFRLLLNKISFGLVPNAAIFIMQTQPELTFRQVMRRADTTTVVLKLIVGCLLAWCCRSQWLGVWNRLLRYV